MCVNDLACTGRDPAGVPRLPGRRPARPGRGGRAGALDRRRLRGGRLRARRRRDGRDARASTRRATSTWRASPAAWWSGAEMLGAHRVARGRRDRRHPLLGLPLQRLLAGAGAGRRRARSRPTPTCCSRRRASTCARSQALAAAGVEVHSAAHITGGGLPENLPRALPGGPAGRAGRRARGSAGPASTRCSPPGAWPRTRPGAPSTWASGCAWSWRPRRRRRGAGDGPRRAPGGARRGRAAGSDPWLRPGRCGWWCWCRAAAPTSRA